MQFKFEIDDIVTINDRTIAEILAKPENEDWIKGISAQRELGVGDGNIENLNDIKELFTACAMEAVEFKVEAVTTALFNSCEPVLHIVRYDPQRLVNGYSNIMLWIVQSALIPTPETLNSLLSEYGLDL